MRNGLVKKLNTFLHCECIIFKQEDAYQLIIANVNHRSSPRDAKVRDTVIGIVDEFFRKNNTTLLYICETGDSKQSMRSRLFEHNEQQQNYKSALEISNKIYFLNDSLTQASKQVEIPNFKKITLYLLVFPSQQPVMVIPEGSNLWLMLCHALFCTMAMYILQIMDLKRLSAFTVNLTYNQEPCYTICLAFFIFGEGREINFSFYIGITLILLSVLLQTLRVGYNHSTGRELQKHQY